MNYTRMLCTCVCLKVRVLFFVCLCVLVWCVLYVLVCVYVCMCVFEYKFEAGVSIPVYELGVVNRLNAQAHLIQPLTQMLCNVVCVRVCGSCMCARVGCMCVGRGRKKRRSKEKVVFVWCVWCVVV